MITLKLYSTASLTNDFIKNYLDRMGDRYSVDFHIEVIDSVDAILAASVSSIPTIRYRDLNIELGKGPSLGSGLRKALRIIFESENILDRIPEIICHLDNTHDYSNLFYAYRLAIDVGYNLRLLHSDSDVLDLDLLKAESYDADDFERFPLVFDETVFNAAMSKKKHHDSIVLKVADVEIPTYVCSKKELRIPDGKIYTDSKKILVNCDAKTIENDAFCTRLRQDGNLVSNNESNGKVKVYDLLITA